MTARSDHDTAYRNPAKGRIFIVAGVYGAAMMIALLVLSRPDAVDALELALGLAASLWAIFRLSRCGIYAGHDGIRVVNPLSSTYLRWAEVRRFVLAEQGPCRIERVHGSTVKVFGIQHSPWQALRGSRRRTREAAMIDDLNARLDERLGSS